MAEGEGECPACRDYDERNPAVPQNFFLFSQLQKIVPVPGNFIQNCMKDF
jgi:hypothetical protein